MTKIQRVLKKIEDSISTKREKQLMLMGLTMLFTDEVLNDLPLSYETGDADAITSLAVKLRR